ncbi:MAG: ScpA family protein [Pseudomonadota bacterium]|nr:ScpA family protein [Pseudomonadota bacterium]
MSAVSEGFEEPSEFQSAELVLDIEGFEGPIDLLLTLARQQKVDLTRISILTLAEQYLSFVAAAKSIRIELAADFLVMAAWLAYLKSRLLLPDAKGDDEINGPELAEGLTFQLRRLASMRDAGDKLLVRPRLGRDVYARGAPEGMEVIRTTVYEVTLYELLKSYADNRRRVTASQLTIEPSQLFSLNDALERIQNMIGKFGDWVSLLSFLPDELVDGVVGRSAIASTFAASLEMVKEGRAEIRQSAAFGPIYVKEREGLADG